MPSVIDQRLASRFHQLQLEKVLRVEGVSDEIQARIELTLREIIRVLAGTQSIEKKTRIAGELLRRMVPVATRNTESLFERLAGWSHAATINVLARNVPRHWMRFVNPITVYAGEAEISANVPIVDLPPYGFAETPTEPVAGKRLPDDQWAAFLRENVFEPPSRERVSQFIHRKINGKDWQERFTELSRKIADPDKLMNTLATQYAQGMTQDQMARNVRSQVQGIASSARRIVRTEGLRIANEAHRETYQQLGPLMAGAQILETLDENTRPHHAARNGTIYWVDGRKRPHISEMPQLPDEPNCRGFDVPVLKPPAEFENDPAIRTEFSNAAGNAIPDPSVYTQWFERADEGRRRMAVGVKRYNTVQTILQRKPEWTDFINEDGKLLSVAHLRGETERSRIARKARVDQAIASRRELISQVNRFGFTSKHLDPPKPPKKSSGRTVGKVPVPKHITFTGTATKLSREVWQAIGEGIKDEQQAISVGAIVRDRVERETSKMAAEYLQSRDRLEAIRATSEPYKVKLAAGTLTEKERQEFAKLLDDWSEAITVNKRNYEQLTAMRRKAVLSAVSQVRDLGGVEQQVRGLKKMIPAVRQAEQNFPADWLKQSRDAGSFKLTERQRGAYVPDKLILAISNPDDISVMLHELIHRVEHTLKTPGRKSLADLQREFKLRRAGREALSVIYRGKQEFGYKDQFADHYVGKVYAGDQFHEIMSTGIEGLLQGRYEMWERDPEMINFVLGILCGV